MRYLCVSILAVFSAAAQPCEMPSTIRTAINQANGADARKSVREQFPQSYFAHTSYQDATPSHGILPEAVQTEYRELRQSHAGDPLYETLYARAITGARTPEAIDVLQRVVERNPAYPYARLKLVEIYSAPAFFNASKLRENLEAYEKSCPTALDGFYHAGQVDDPTFLKQQAAALRKIIEGRTDYEVLNAYNTLWTLEFKSVPLGRQDAVREQVRQDVAKLRKLDASANPNVLYTLRQGYKLLGDEEGAKWAEQQKTAAAGPTRPTGAADAIARWRAANQPKGPISNNQEFQEQIAKQADEWIREFPNDPAPYREKFDALRSLQDAAQEDVVEAGEDWMRVYEKHPAGSGASPYLQVAQYYAMRNMRYSELPALLEKGLSDVRDWGVAPVSDLYPGNAAARLAPYVPKWANWNTAASIYTKIKQFDKAHEMLSKFGASLKEMKPAGSESDRENLQYYSFERTYWDSMARLATAENHKLDALVFGRRSDMVSQAMTLMNAEMQQYRDRVARETWKQLGGTDEGFEVWLALPGSTPKRETRPGVASTMQPWRKLEKPLPDFQLSDAAGKTWHLSDLKGKVTLINIWATWCGPCRNELPYLQKLYSKLQDRKDIAVLTLNVDDNPGLILPFLAENKYSFPVLSAPDLVKKLVPELIIPRNWIVDAEGVIRGERLGFGSGDDKFVDDMLASLEQARAPR